MVSRWYLISIQNLALFLNPLKELILSPVEFDEGEFGRTFTMAKMIVKNAIKCKNCGDVIESFDRWDFKQCSCKRVGVDGGLDYLRRCYTDSTDDFEELSEFVEIDDDE